MNSWKNKIFGLFADSPSTTPHLDDGSPKVRRSYGEGRPWSSLVSLLVPSAGSDNSTQDKHRHLKSFHSLPLRLKSKDLDLEDDLKFEERPPVCENKELVARDEDQGPRSGRSTDRSDVFEEANSPQDLHKPMLNVIDESSFISADLYKFLQSSLPNIVKGCRWILLYSTLKHGISLRTLIRKSVQLSGPCLLIVGDMQGAVFGGLLECPLKPTAKRKYQGTNQTFVFTTIYGEPRLFRPTGANRYFYMCLNNMLALGGGGNFALCLDGDLLCGSSGPCETFGNLCLAHSTEFELKNVELWGFAYSSEYLS